MNKFRCTKVANMKNPGMWSDYDCNYTNYYKSFHLNNHFSASYERSMKDYIARAISPAGKGSVWWTFIMLLIDADEAVRHVFTCNKYRNFLFG